MDASRRSPHRRINSLRPRTRRRLTALEILEDRLLPSLLGQQLFPSDNPWNQKITTAPVAANSTAVINNIVSLYGDGRFHPDFGQDTNGNNPLYGIPFNVVHGNTQPKVHVVIDAFATESDIQDAPVPPNAVIEGDNQNGPVSGLNNRGDSHLIVWDEDANVAYEFYRASRPSENSDGQWHADQESVWDLKTNAFRTIGWTSADAAGLPILPGLVRPDEALPVSQGGQGAINHALRFTLENNIILDQFLYPASHVADPGNTDRSIEPPMGARFRLKASVDISGLNPESKVIAQALKDYGLIVADNGSNFFMTGASDSVDASNQRTLTWDDNDIQDTLHGLKSLHFSDFELVDTAPAVTGLSASSGSAGSTISVLGQNFSGAAGRLQVRFGSAVASGVTVVDDSHLTVSVPAGSGTVDVQVQSGVSTPADTENYASTVFGYGISAISPADQFTLTGSLTVNPPSIPDLEAGSDSGASNTDNITNVATGPVFDVLPSGPNVNAQNVELLRDGAVVATVQIPAGAVSGIVKLVDPGPIPDGAHNYTAKQVDTVDNSSAQSGALAVTIDTVAPRIPTLRINSADDTGIVGDGITAVRRPRFIGAAEPGSMVQIFDVASGAVVATTTATASGSYSAQPASPFALGTAQFEARSVDLAGNVSPNSSPPLSLTFVTIAGDYDADGKADLAVFRPVAPTSQWFILQSKAGGQVANLGQPGDIPLQGDFDGDGKADVALYRPSTGTWTILRSQLGVFSMQFGEANVDIPVPADYDGDGKTDLALYRPTTGQWFILQSTAGARVMQFGQANVDRPEPGDYDGDGKADLAVYRPTTGQWFILQSTLGGKILTLGGLPGDRAVPGAYDGGGKTEAAIYRPSTGQWLINGPSGVRTISFGEANVDIPVPQDYDGDGKTDLAVYRPTTAQWFILQSTAGPRVQQFGEANVDIPVPEPLDYRFTSFGLRTRTHRLGAD